MTLLLLSSGGGVLASASAAGLVVCAVLCLPSLVSVAAGKTRPVSLGAAELAGPLFLAVYALTGLFGTYPGAAVPAILHAVLAFAVFRTAASASATAEGARSQALALVAIAGATAALAVVTSLAAGGPANDPASAPFVARGHLAAFLAAALPLCVALAADSGPTDGSVSPRNGRARLLPRALSVANGLFLSRAALALVVVAIAFSVSRGGIATAGAVLLASVALLVHLPKRDEPLPPRVVSAAAAVMLPLTALWVAKGPLAARLSSGALRTSAVERADILRASWAAFLEHPFLGHGAGGFASAFRPLRPPSVPYFVEHAHADLLEFGVESGILGLAALGIAAVLLGRHLLRGRASPAGRLVAAGVLGVAALLVAGLADFPLRLGAIAVLGAWLLGIAAGAAQLRAAARRVHEPDPGDPPAPRGERAGATVGALALLAVTGLAIAQSAAASLSRGDEAARLRATHLAPWNAGVWREAADAALARGLAGEPAAFDVAAARFDAALERNSVDAPSLAGRGRLALLAGDPDRAVDLLARAVAADPLHPAWRLAHFDALFQSGRIDDARNAVAAALSLRPGLAGELLPAFFDAAPEQAAALVEEVTDATVRAEAARLLAANGDLPSARLAADRAAVAEPLRFAALAADLALAAGDDAAAVDALDRALAQVGVECAAFALSETEGVHANLAPNRSAAPSPFRQYRDPGDHVAALALLLRRGRMKDASPSYAPCAVGLFPDESAAWSFAAERAGPTGDPAFIESAWRRAAELAPANPSPLLGLSRWFASRGVKDAALQAARDAEARSTCEGAGAREVARLLAADGRRAAAVTHLEALDERCAGAPWIADAIATLR